MYVRKIVSLTVYLENFCLKITNFKKSHHRHSGINFRKKKVEIQSCYDSTENNVTHHRLKYVCMCRYTLKVYTYFICGLFQNFEVKNVFSFRNVYYL